MAQVRMKTSITLRVAGQGVGHSRTDVSVRDVGLVIDEPKARGGSNMGPTPTDTALAALIGCTNVIGQKCAAALGVDVGHLAIEVSCDFDRRGVTLEEEIAVPFTAIRQVVTADGPATQEDLQRVAAEVEEYCPLSKLFVGAGTEVTTVWKKA